MTLLDDTRRISPSPTEILETADGDSLITRLTTSGFELPDGVTFENFSAVDSDVITSEKLSVEDVVSIVQKGDTVTDNEDEVDDSPIPPPPPSAKEADKSLSVLTRYFESRDPVIIGEQCLTLVSTLKRAIANDIMNCASVQTKITDFTVNL